MTSLAVSIKHHLNRYLVPSAKVCYFAKCPRDARTTTQQVYTVPCTRHTSLHEGEINVLLTVHNETIANHWLRELPGCYKQGGTLNDATQLAVMLRLSVIVVLNTWCDVSSRETEYEVHSVAYEVAKSSSKWD